MGGSVNLNLPEAIVVRRALHHIDVQRQLTAEERALFDRLTDYVDTELAAYRKYIHACHDEGLLEHSFEMWNIHGRPKGPDG